MTKNEALLFFPFKEGEDILDLYEEYLFDYKNYFLSKFPIQKIFTAKAKKMNQMHEAFILLGGEINTPTTFQNIKYEHKENILECFNNYQKIKLDLKSKLYNCNNAMDINSCLKLLFQLEKAYAQNWSISTNLSNVEAIISKEPDPMSLLNAINEFNTLGGYTFNDLNTMKNISPELLINEAKRLSLTLKI
jgi:hypothetical protein